MYRTGKIALLIFVIFVINACSTSETVTESSDVSGIPAWYLSSGFEADTLNYSGFATAIASDSLTAISRASAQARATLENHIAQKLENVRSNLEDSGSMDVIKPDFIITLRNAHASLEASSDVVETIAVEFDNYYRGFAKATIQKPALKTLLESGFSDKMEMWKTFSSSDVFSAELEL